MFSIVERPAIGLPARMALPKILAPLTILLLPGIVSSAVVGESKLDGEL